MAKTMQVRLFVGFIFCSDAWCTQFGNGSTANPPVRHARWFKRFVFTTL